MGWAWKDAVWKWAGFMRRIDDLVVCFGCKITCRFASAGQVVISHFKRFGIGISYDLIRICRATAEFVRITV